ncbi:uncharacterized protein RCO7_07477 [Rhynchosporium graminicola]|uniref:BTB domain-containing protein n=1 Tax=Rhynchosporium graminicola TaxID=2792576 RepID=A0A1E1LMV2_9HELO|nr:uncharacterized protein RCO7_07477 [Rhynchosporium commune]
MHFLSTVAGVVNLAICVCATPATEKRQLGTATVSLGQTSGAPSQLASGFIYGIPDNGSSVSTQIPDHFFTDIKFNYCRAGGAQLPEPSRGWIFGPEEFDNRFVSALSNYRTSRKFGARFILLVHDLWGADSLQSSDTVFPGDNNDFTNYNAFLTRLISSLKANDMIEGLDLDIWNEPDVSNFWARSPEQWVQMWGNAYHRFRKELPGTIITGPSVATPPDRNMTWWDAFGSFITSNDSVPDIYTWHNLETSYDPVKTLPVLTQWREKYGLPDKPKAINEYAGPAEQIPSTGAWFISRLERYNIQGLRANWASAYELHDYLGNMLGKPGAGNATYEPSGTGYWSVGEWQVYKYYASSMTGERVATSGSADGIFDVYATRGGAANTVKILAGTRGTTGLYDITVTGLSAVGVSSRSVNIRTRRFDNNGKYGQAGAPVDLGVYGHIIENDQITFHVQPETASTAYAFDPDFLRHLPERTNDNRSPRLHKNYQRTLVCLGVDQFNSTVKPPSTAIMDLFDLPIDDSAAEKSKMPSREHVVEVKGVGSLTRSTGMVTTHVGPEKVAWLLHEAVLCNASKFFKDAFQGGFSETLTKTTHLVEDDPAVFEKFVDYVYANFPSSNYASGSSFAHSLEPEWEVPEEHLTTWYGLEIFAEKLGMSELKDLALESWRNYEENCKMDISLTYDLSSEEVKFIFENGDPDSEFRSHIVDVAVNRFMTWDFEDFESWGKLMGSNSLFAELVSRDIKDHIKQRPENSCGMLSCSAHGSKPVSVEGDVGESIDDDSDRSRLVM